VDEQPLPGGVRYWGETGGGNDNFIAQDSSKFQLDGNLGALALVTESLVCCRVLQCAAVYCSVLQRGAVCCSALHC